MSEGIQRCYSVSFFLTLSNEYESLIRAQCVTKVIFCSAAKAFLNSLCGLETMWYYIVENAQQRITPFITPSTELIW